MTRPEEIVFVSIIRDPVMTLVCFGVRFSLRMVFRRSRSSYDAGRGTLAGDLGVLGRGAGEDRHAGRGQQVDLEHGLGQLGRTGDQLARQVAEQVGIRVEVEGLLGELGEDAGLGDRAGALETGEAHPVHAPAGLGQGRQPARDGADILRGAVEVAIGGGGAGGVDALVVDVAVIEEGDVVVDLNLLAEVLRSKSSLKSNYDLTGLRPTKT